MQKFPLPVICCCLLFFAPWVAAQSLDLTYFWYPTENLVFRLRGKNLLDETKEIDQGGVRVFETKPGTTISMDVKWQY